MSIYLIVSLSDRCCECVLVCLFGCLMAARVYVCVRVRLVVWLAGCVIVRLSVCLLVVCWCSCLLACLRVCVLFV